MFAKIALASLEAGVIFESRFLLREPATEDVAEDDGVVVVFVVGCVDECQSAPACVAAKCCEARALVLEFVEVAAAELGEACWVVSEPFAQVRARG